MARCLEAMESTQLKRTYLLEQSLEKGDRGGIQRTDWYIRCELGKR